MTTTILTSQPLVRTTTLHATALLSSLQAKVTQLNATLFHTIRHHDTRVTQITSTLLVTLLAAIGRRTHRLPPPRGIIHTRQGGRPHIHV